MLAKAAYRSGQRLTDERDQTVYNYVSRGQEVVHSEIMVPPNAAEWLKAESPEGATSKRQRETRQRLWTMIETIEKRSDSQLAREFILSLPRGLNKQQRIELVRGWCEAELVSQGLAVDVSIHKSKSDGNPHAHVLCTTRPVQGEGFGKKPSMLGKFNGRGLAGLAAKNELELWRESFCRHVNLALEKAGRPERADHRSLKDRGIEKEPEPKIGRTAAQMKREGREAESKAHERNRFVKSKNEVLPYLRDFERGKQLRRFPQYTTWFGKAFERLKKVRQRVAEMFKTEIGVGNRWRKHVLEQKAAPPPQKQQGFER